MKKLIYVHILVVLLALIVSCPSPVSTLKEIADVAEPVIVDGTPGTVNSVAQSPLPPDVVNDSIRSAGGEFTFETLFPVHVDLTVALYEPDPAGGVKPDPLPSNSAAVYASLLDSKGNTVFHGKVSSVGNLQTTVYLPSAEEDITLKLEASGFVSRAVAIRNMVKYQEVKRSMSMLSLTSLNQNRLLLSTGITAGPDDVFVLNIPSTGNITVAFEDLFGQAQAGDADYNDFIASYSIQETYESGLVTQIQVNNAEAIRKFAGYNHRFGIRIDSFDGNAVLSGSYITASGGIGTLSGTVQAPAEIILFENSSTAVGDGKDANFTLTFEIPQSVGEGGLSRPPYNPYVYVINTRHDIHLIDRQPITGSINPTDRFFDSEGFPWVLLVPADWESPAEGQRIEVPYPRFTRWRESGGVLSPDWYLYNDPWVEASSLIVFSSDRDGDFEIYSLDIGTNTLSQLTSNGATDKNPALSSDGSKIAFVSNVSGNYEIYTMNTDGTGVSSSLAILAGSFFGRPSWSPDGSQIVYDDNWDIYTMNSDGTGKANITNSPFTNEIEPAWSPDGTLIAYSASDGGDYEIYVSPSTGLGSSTILTNNAALDQKPSWSPDGTRIAYSTYIGSNFEIYSIKSNDGSDAINLTNSAGENEYSPSWSVHGIAYVKNDDIYTFQPESAGSETVIINDTAIDQEPSW